MTLLCLAAFIGGLIDSIAGGGGLVTVPALLLAGIPTQAAIGTNKIVGALGTAAALANFARSGLVLWRLAAIGIGFALLGATAGSKFVLSFDSETAGRIVVALLPFAAAATLIPRRSILIRTDFTPLSQYLILPLVCFFVGFYDGFFGPGTGSFFILAFHLALRMDLIQASALAKVFNLTSNISSLCVFLWYGQVVFKYGIPMALAGIAGNLVGSQLAIHTGPTVVRRFLMLSLLILFTSLIWKQYMT